MVAMRARGWKVGSSSQSEWAQGRVLWIGVSGVKGREEV